MFALHRTRPRRKLISFCAHKLFIFHSNFNFSELVSRLNFSRSAGEHRSGGERLWSFVGICRIVSYKFFRRSRSSRRVVYFVNALLRLLLIAPTSNWLVSRGRREQGKGITEGLVISGTRVRSCVMFELGFRPNCSATHPTRGSTISGKYLKSLHEAFWLAISMRNQDSLHEHHFNGK
jgi:hypothetical protein